MKVCGSGVAVVDVVGVLPDVNGQQGIVAIGQGISGIGGIENGDFLALLGQPGPSRAEIGQSLSWKFFDEVVDAAPFADDQVLQLAGGFGLVGRDAVPIEGVVPVLSAVVENFDVFAAG